MTTAASPPTLAPMEEGHRIAALGAVVRVAVRHPASFLYFELEVLKHL